jgi:hypothetical protein
LKKVGREQKHASLLRLANQSISTAGNSKTDVEKARQFGYQVLINHG